MQAVVISGLAQGIGREVAKLLAASKVPVAGFDVDEEGIESLRGELEEMGCDHLLMMLDIGDRPGILKFRDAALEKFGRVDVVLSNVGIGFFGPFEEVDLEKALKCLEINVIGTAAIFQAFLPSMRQNRRGRLIAVSSLVGQIPFPFESIYAASKFAVEGLVLSLRYEVEPFGVKVALIQPAQVSTSFAASVPDIREGKWEITAKTKVPGAPMDLPAVTQTQCLTDKDYVPQSLPSGQECEITESKVIGNTVTWTIKGKGQHGQMKGTGKLTYKGDTFEGEQIVSMAGEGMEITTKITGRRIGACD